MGSQEVKEGYKLTEVGVIPEDWDIFSLQALFSLKNGINADKKQYGKGIKFINILEIIKNNSIFYQDIPGLISLDTHTIKSNCVLKGDVLFNRTSETQEEIGLSSVYLDDKEVVFGGFVIRARPISNLINCYFSKYAFSSRIVRNQIIKKGQGAVRANIGQSDLKEVYIPLPPLPEQEKIAQVLSDFDRAIAQLDKLIIKKRNVKQGTMQQLLTGKKRLPGFSGEWEVKELGKLLKVKHGKSQHEVFDIYGEYPILGTGGEFGRAKTYLYNKPSVLIGRKGTIDLPQYIDTPFWTIDTLFYTEIFSNVLAKFIFYRFNLINWYSYNEASGVPSLNAKTIENITISIPPLAEQKEIAQILTDMDAEIEALEKKRNKYQAIKQGMMQELLTGKTRLK